MDHVVDQAFVGAEILQSGEETLEYNAPSMPTHEKEGLDSLIRILTGNNLPRQSIILTVQKPEQFLIHQRLGALQQQGKVTLRHHVQPQ